jgi:cytochrome c oxidase cbb3-type subunit 2
MTKTYKLIIKRGLEMKGTVTLFRGISAKILLMLLSIVIVSISQQAVAEGTDAKGNPGKKVYAEQTTMKGHRHSGVTTGDIGKSIYEEHCQICHGAKGDGKGLAGIMKRSEKSGRLINVEPRDFTIGVFRFRSTGTGCLPTDEDLILLVDKGIPRSFMPSHKDDLKLEDKKALVEHLKTFSTRWKEEEPCKSIPVKKPKWVGSSKSVEKGKKVYKEMKCWECHGDDGKGKGPKSDQLKDDWGKPIVPFDFTTGATKMGAAPENVYTAYTTGLDGTGMPSYEDSLKEDERWHLVSYTLKLMGRVK